MPVSDERREQLNTNQKEMFETSFKRPRNYFQLSPSEQWEIDKDLNILDLWYIPTNQERKRFKDYFYYGGTYNESGRTID